MPGADAYVQIGRRWCHGSPAQMAPPVLGVAGDNAGRKDQDGTVSWTVIVPVKRLALAKSRLRGALPSVEHDTLVLAMALDTVTAALASPVVGRVAVVTSDPDAERAALEAGAEVIVDVPDAGLNPALAYAATVLRPKQATLPGVVAVAADLAALRTADLTAALHAAETAARDAPRRMFVPDAAGTGTVLLAATHGAGLEPCFGLGSAAAHRASGAIELAGEWPSLRHDIDTAADLAEAVVLGLGPRTAAVTAAAAGTPA
jgi:2-phospho-L-lactate guanylyltransferase